MFPYWGHDNSKAYPDVQGFDRRQISKNQMYLWSYHPEVSRWYEEAVEKGLVPLAILDHVTRQRELLARLGMAEAGAK